jgi:hypothetical protein
VGPADVVDPIESGASPIESRRCVGPAGWVAVAKSVALGFEDQASSSRLVAQGFSHIRGAHYNQLFRSIARMAAMRAGIALAAVEDLELESVDIPTAFLNGDTDAEIYMKIPEGLKVDGDPKPGEDPKRCVVRPLKGLYGIKQKPRIWTLELHSILSTMGSIRTDCNHSVYIYQPDDLRVRLLKKPKLSCV